MEEQSLAVRDFWPMRGAAATASMAGFLLANILPLRMEPNIFDGTETPWIADGLDEAARLIEWLRNDTASGAAIRRAGVIFAQSLRAGGRIITCGNGGSMCDAMHLAEELSGRFRRDRPALAAMAISDPSHLSCVANDWGFEYVFARAVEAWGSRGDVLVAFSTSGNSANVLRAAQAARVRGMTVVGLIGGWAGNCLTWPT